MHKWMLIPQHDTLADVSITTNHVHVSGFSKVTVKLLIFPPDRPITMRS